VTFIEGSITDLDLLMETQWTAGSEREHRRCDTFPGVDGIFGGHSLRAPLASNEANVTGTLDVLVAAKDCGVPAVVAAPSVYGDIPLPGS